MFRGPKIWGSRKQGFLLSSVPHPPILATLFRVQVVFVGRVQIHSLLAVNFLSTKLPEFSEEVRPRAGPLVITVHECQSRETQGSQTTHSQDMATARSRRYKGKSVQESPGVPQQ